MKNVMNYSILLLLLGISYGLRSQSLEWDTLDTGLHLALYDAPKPSTHGDQKITILKIDPKYYKFSLFSAKKGKQYTKTAKEWAIQEQQIAVINAGMYRMDHATNMGYMKNYDFVNNPKLNKDNTIAAFNPIDDTLPPFQIIDLKCQNWEELKQQYHSYTQSIRMVDCQQKNRWSQQPKQWSMVVLGKDKAGNALFIFTRSPYAVHDFIDMVLAAPLDLYNLMYLEGGPEASFYLRHGTTEVTKMGSYETGFMENDENHEYWPIPNVIGISKK